jgi:transposase-like protein
MFPNTTAWNRLISQTRAAYTLRVACDNKKSEKSRECFKNKKKHQTSFYIL